MKNMYKLLFVITFLTLSFLSGNVNAQCTLHGTDVNGNAVVSSVSCDFPVYVNTGNEAADVAAFHTAQNLWSSSNPAAFDNLSAVQIVYYEIPQADFELMSPERKAAITAKDNVYHLIP